MRRALRTWGWGLVLAHALGGCIAAQPTARDAEAAHGRRAATARGSVSDPRQLAAWVPLDASIQPTRTSGAIESAAIDSAGIEFGAVESRIAANGAPLSIEASNAEPAPAVALTASITRECGSDDCIVVTFNKPMAKPPLARAALPVLNFAPPLEGTWRWFDSKTLRFDADDVPKAQRFELTVAAGTVALDGSRSSTAITQAWDSEPIQLVSYFEPIDQDWHKPIEARFSQVVNATTAQQNISVSVEGRSWPFSVAVEDESVMITLLSEPPAASSVSIKVLPGLQSIEGPLPLGREESFSIQVPPAPLRGLFCTKLVNTPSDEWREPELLAPDQSPARGYCDALEGISIELPGSFERLDEFLKVDPAVDGVNTGRGLWARFELGVPYTVTLETHNSRGEALVSTEGTVIDTPLRGRFTFGGPPLADWASGRVVRTTEVDSILPIAVRNLRAIETRARPLSEEQLFSHLLGKTEGLPAWTRRLRHPTPRIQHDASLGRSVSSLLGSRKPGVYELELRSTGSKGEKQSERRLLNVSDWMLATLATGNTLEVRAQSAKGDAARGPAQGIAVRVRALRSDSPLLSAKTGPDGIARVELAAVREADEKYLVAMHNGEDFAYAVVDVPRTVRETALLFTDRGIYRAGENVQLEGVVQRRTNQGVRPVVGSKYLVVLRGERGGSFFEQEVTTSEFGSFHIAIPLAEQLPRVEYSVELRKPDASEGRRLAATDFVIGDYEPDLFEVEASYNTNETTSGSPLNCLISAKGLHGGPLRGAEVTVRMRTRFVSEEPGAVPPGFEVGTRYNALEDEVSFDGRLDDAGELLVTQTGMVRGKAYPQAAICQAAVRGPHSEVRNAVARATVHPRAYVAFGVAQVQGVTVQRVRVLDPQGFPLAPRKDLKVHLSAAFVRDYDWDTEPTVFEAVHPLGAEPLEVRVPRPPDVQGHVEVVLRARVSDGHTDWAAGESSSVALSVIQTPGVPAPIETRSIGPQGLVVRQLPNTRVASVPEPSVSLSAPKVTEGQSVDVTVEDLSLPSAPGLLHVIGEGVVQTHPFVLVDHRARVRLQVDASMVPEVVVWASIGSVEQRRTAQAELHVGTQGRGIVVRVEPEVRVTQPGARVKVDVQTTFRDKPVSAEVTLYAVDEGSLQMTDYEVPDPVEKLFELDSPRYFDSNSAGERVDFDWSPHGWHTTRSPKVRMGGTMVSRPPYRSNFTQTPLFLTSVVTDEQGRLSHEFELPDSVTRYRLMAVAVSKQGQFGSGQASLQTTQPLILHPSIPRTIWVGDSVLPTVAITSLHERPLLVATQLQWLQGGKVSAQELHLTRLGSGPLQHITAPWVASAAGEVRLRVLASAYDERELRAQFNHAPTQAQLLRLARGQGPVPWLFQDAVSVEGEVRRPLHEQVLTLTGQIAQHQSVILNGLDDTLPGPTEAGLNLELSNSPLATLRPALRELLEYPHGCTEQLSSRILPHTAIPTLLLALGLRTEDLTTQGQRTEAHQLLGNAELEPLVQRVLANQNESGGFGLWQGSSVEPELSAYVAIVLNQAGRVGLNVPKTAIEPLRQYLLAEARRLLVRDPEQSDDADRVSDPTTAALLLYGASRFSIGATFNADGAWTELQRALDAAEAQLPVGSLALWASALDDPHSLAQRARRAQRIVAGLQKSTHGLTAPAPANDDAFTTQTHATAYALLGLVKIAPRHPELFRLVTGLLHLRQQGTWGSTQETAWALLALQAYAEAHPEAGRELLAQLTLGDRHWSTPLLRPGRPVSVFAPIERLQESASDGQLTLTTNVSDRVTKAGAVAYYSARVNTWKADFAHASEQGLKLEVDFVSESVFERDANLAVGAMGRFVVTLSSPEPRHFVAVEVPLPAGVRGMTLSGLYPMHSDLISHYEFRDDRALYYIDTLPAGTSSFSFFVLGEHAGRFQMAPAQVYEMYDESVRARTDTRWFSVAPHGTVSVLKPEYVPREE